jgi:hypothetical protein
VLPKVCERVSQLLAFFTRKELRRSFCSRAHRSYWGKGMKGVR